LAIVFSIAENDGNEMSKGRDGRMLIAPNQIPGNDAFTTGS